MLAVGPVAVAASMFPRAVKDHDSDPTPQRAGVIAILHRVCRAYSAIAVIVPAFGLAAAAKLGVLTDGWVVTAIALTAVAGILLVGAILPRQRAVLLALNPAGPESDPRRTVVAVATTTPPTVRQIASRLAAYTGMFNLVWVLITVVMIIRPGSTTGV